MKSKTKTRWNHAKRFAMGFGILALLVAITPTLVTAWVPPKAITIVVGSRPGGAYDTIARHTAQYLPGFLGSKRAAIVQNMPGAGDRVMMNYVRRSKPDGCTIALFEGDALQQARAFGFIDWDPLQEITILGGIWTPPPCALIVATHPAVRPDPLQTWEELKKITKPIRIASYAQAGELALIPVFEKHNIPYIIVPGYEGLRPAASGILRGEADIVTGAGTMIPLGYVKDGTCVPLMVVSDERYKGMPEVGIISFETAPTVVELGVPEFGKIKPGRIWFGPKNLPPEVENATIASLNRVSEDPRTLEWMKKVGIPMTFQDKKTVLDAYDAGTKLFTRFRDLAKKIGFGTE